MSPLVHSRPVWPGLLLVGASWLFVSGPTRAKAASENQTRPTADRVTLPDGATIELVGVSDYPTRHDSWWRADGTPLPRPPVAKLVCPPTPATEPLMRLFAFYVVTDGQAEIDEPRALEDECCTQGTCTKVSQTESGRSLLQEHIIAAMRPAARIELTVNYDGGPWQTVATTDGHEGKHGDPAFRRQAIWEDTSTGKRVPEIWVAHNVDLDPEHVWLFAVDKDNVLHRSRQDFNAYNGHLQIRLARFPDVLIDRVKEYRLVTHLADRRLRFKPDANPPEAAPTDDVVWGPAEAQSDAATISAACRLHMKKGRIVAVDEQDHEHIAKFGQYPSAGNFCILTAVFPELPPARIKEFRFQRRTHHHRIEFRNVSLHAGQMNPAQIWLDGKRYVPRAM